MVENLYMEQRYCSLQKEISITEKELDSYPPGNILCYKNGNSSKWFCQYTDTDGKCIRKYIPKSNHEFAEKLAEKRLLTRKLIDMKNESLAIERYFKVRRKCKVKYGMPDEECYRRLLTKIYNWEEAPYSTNEQYKDHLIVPGPKGQMMRSKSEAMIAQVLLTNNIGYRYESEQNFGGIIMHPDFSILHPITGRLYIWEHLGLMSNGAYQNNALKKINIYINNGYVPGDNLILTFETPTAPLDINYVQLLAEYYFCRQ